MGAAGPSRVIGLLAAVLLTASAALAVATGPRALAQPSAAREGVHEGVASCAGSTCHSRPVASGLVVRQDELITWQDPSRTTGAHSRAWRVLTESRGQNIARRMGLGPAQNATACLGCHSDPAPAGQRGRRFQVSDGVGCESCHGGSSAWISTHYAVGATHASNVARGMRPLDTAKGRAAVCLDCHFGGSKPGQFVSHEMMAAGHPRVAFELDLFSSLIRHWDVDADYRQRKGVPGGVQMWAVGQAMALERALTLYASKGANGAFPEFYFFDCHSCHRPITDDRAPRLTVQPNPGRPGPIDTPPFNDENMIMLAAAARVAAPGLASRLEADSRAFHQALQKDRAESVRAAGRLAATGRALSDAFSSRDFSRADTFAIIDQVLAGEARRYTDYTGSAQAVMAADTLLNALVAAGQVDRGAAQRVRPSLDRAYREVREPNSYRPEAFRQSLAAVAQGVRALR